MKQEIIETLTKTTDTLNNAVDLLNKTCKQVSHKIEKSGLYFHGTILSSESYRFLNPIEIIVAVLVGAKHIILVSKTGTAKSTLTYALAKLIFPEDQIGRIMGSPNLNESVMKEIEIADGQPSIKESKIAKSKLKLIDEINRILPSAGQAIVKELLWNAEFVIGSMNPNDDRYSVFNIEPSIASNCAFLDFDRAASHEDKQKIKLLKASDLNIHPLEIDQESLKNVMEKLHNELYQVPLDEMSSIIINSLRANCCHQDVLKNSAIFNNLNEDEKVTYFKEDVNQFLYRYDGLKPDKCKNCGCNCSLIGAIPDNTLTLIELTAKSLAALRHCRTESKLVVTRDDILAACELYLRKYTVKFFDENSPEKETVFKHLANYNNAIVQFTEDFEDVLITLEAGEKLTKNEMDAIESFRKTINPSVARAVIQHYKNK